MEPVHMLQEKGRGNRLNAALVIVCGVAALVSSLLSFVSIWLQSKNYRKPLLQRYVIRILLMVPIYAASSWGSIMSLTAALYLDPLRDIYEAFTIYTFFQLLINFLGGERSLIIMMHGRPPKNHAWPLNYVFSKVDISDPHTFLAIKRGILQYAWLKPILSIMTIILKLAGVYQESKISVNSGYLWIAILYNLSVTVSLYSLAMFWVCMSQDLQPFRPVPKFLCIKLIIFASYWQGFFLSILQVLGAIPSGVEGYGSADNLAAAIQDALICIEMPIFAVAHWYAFSWHDYADVTISAARMPVKHALRDAFGIRDLVQDSKETFGGKKYEYRAFDSGDNVLAHEESGSRRARLQEGMRYSRGGKGKYWIRKPGEGASARTPLLRGSNSSGSDPSPSHGTIANDELDGGGIDDDMEKLYAKARALEFGDWNYPVITAHVASRDRWQHANPHLLTTSTNRNILHPTKLGKDRRENQIEERFNKGKGPGSSAGTDEGGGEQSGHKVRAPVVEQLIRGDSSTSSRSVKSGRSQLVDVVVEDEEAEEAERVRARKEGGPKWNKNEPEHFVRTYDDEDQGTDIRHGFEPADVPPDFSHDNSQNEGGQGASNRGNPAYDIEDGRNVWGSDSPR